MSFTSSSRAARPTAHILAVLACVLAAPAAAPASPADEASRVLPNDNRHPAGASTGRTLAIALRAATGAWQPEGAAGPTLSVEAFGEVDRPLVVPAPLIRVDAGTEVTVSVANELTATLAVHGLCARDGSPCAPLAVPPGERRTARFAASRAGTYHYWATTMGAPVPFRELAGALVVDDPGAPRDDRVFVITEWSSLSTAQLRSVVTADEPDATFAALRPGIAFMVNGRSWPDTERLTYRRGDAVRWRVLNLSSQAHPMHLHGFYFEVESLGDGRADTPVAAAERHAVVTQLLPPAGTMALRWTPERAGNWLFHCHIMNHVSPARRLAPAAAAPPPEGEASLGGPHGGTGAHAEHHDDGGRGMAGLVLGVSVTDPAGAAAPAAAVAPRRITMELTRGDGAPPSLGVRLHGERVDPALAQPASPGAPLVLRQGEPAEITVVNRLDEPTAIHWHGIELDSYYDGVHGWSGAGSRVAPMIAPGAAFVVRMTPPRAGTFIYHTHVHDERQLPLGLYGALIVAADGEPPDAPVDQVMVIARQGVDPAAPDVIVSTTPFVVNGSVSPHFSWHRGERRRVRLINITPDDIVTVSLVRGGAPVTWTPVAKDGAALPDALRRPRPARQPIAVGETYDFEIDVPSPARLWLEVTSPAGRWGVQGQVVVR
jgi:FtsP/CotA-like multicopper oxidase with cupredoxin domain